MFNLHKRCDILGQVFACTDSERNYITNMLSFNYSKHQFEVKSILIEQSGHCNAELARDHFDNFTQENN